MHLHGAPAEWLPNENAFSLGARFHRALGNRLSASTTLTLFGDKRVGCAHDLPGRLDHFSERTAGVFGSGRAIALERTILPFYLAFRSEADAQAAIATLCGGSIGSLKFRLGLLTSRFGAAHPLKACPECMRSDVREYGVAYWHGDHQIPGAWVCLRHQRLLVVCCLKVYGAARFEWHLPDEATFTEPTPAARYEYASVLTEVAIAVAHHAPGLRLHPEQVRRAYVDELVRKGLASISGRLHPQRMGDSYFSFCELRRSIPDLALPSSETDAFAQVSRLVRPGRFGAHPLRHVLAILWLFGTRERFIASLECGATPAGGRATSSEPEVSADRRRDHLLAALSSGTSVTRSATKAGVSVQTALSWAAEEGVAISRRPQKLRPSLHKTLIRLLALGVSKATIENSLGLSRSTVDRVLRAERSVARQRAAVLFLRERAKHRKSWSSNLRAHGRLGMKVLRVSRPASYAWLYRNDRDWLRLHGTPPHLTAGNNVAVKWDARDRALSAEVKRAALRLWAAQPTRPLTQKQMLACLPELSKKLKRLDRLPLTLQALTQALATRALQINSCGEPLLAT